MVNASDADAIISRLQSLLGITYDQARNLVNGGSVGFSVPVSDEEITVNASITTSEFEPSAIKVSGKTYKSGSFINTSPTANATNEAYAVTAGKSLYITTLVVYANGANRIRIGDNLSGNVEVDETLIPSCIIVGLGSVSDSYPLSITFPVPLKISTTLDFICAATTSAGISWVGWEE